MQTLVTGAAGFIGYHVAQQLLARGDEVVGLDNVNDYYDVGLKEARLSRLAAHPGFSFVRADLADRGAIDQVFQERRPSRVIHLAAQAGVRHSIAHPHIYVSSNVTGFLHVLEACRHFGVSHLTYASTSSVYGANTKQPFSVHDGVDHPLTLYAATKRSNELMAHAYAHLYGLPVTGLRFFTVYGPWGRPDMALFMFTKAILAGQPIDVFNHGEMARDFTYVDDIVDGIVRASDSPATSNVAWASDEPDPATSSAPFRVFNIGNSRPTSLLRFIEAIERAVGKQAHKRLLPMQAGDVPSTWADISDLSDAVGYRPATPVEVGVPRFVEWFRSYYNV